MQHIFSSEGYPSPGLPCVSPLCFLAVLVNILYIWARFPIENQPIETFVWSVYCFGGLKRL